MAGTRSYQRRNFAEFKATPLNEHLILPLAYQKKADDTRLALANRVNELAQLDVRGEDLAVRDQMIKGFQDEVGNTLDAYNGDVARASREIVPMIGAARNNPAWNEMLRLKKEQDEFEKFRRSAEAQGKVVHDIGGAANQPLLNEDGSVNSGLHYTPKVYEGDYRPFMEKFVDDYQPSSEITQNVGSIKEALRMVGAMGDIHTRQERYKVLKEKIGVQLASEYESITSAYMSGKGAEQIERYMHEGFTQEEAELKVENEMLAAINEREYLRESKKTDVEGFSMSTSGIPASIMSGRKETEIEALANNTVIPINGYVKTDTGDVNWFGNTNVLTTGVVNTKNFQTVEISKPGEPAVIGTNGWGNSKVYLFKQNESIWASDGKGNAEDAVTLYNAKKVGNSVIPVSAGVAYDNKGNLVTGNRLNRFDQMINKGNMIISSDNKEIPNIVEISSPGDGGRLNKVVSGSIDGNTVGGMTFIPPGKYITKQDGDDVVYLKIEDKTFDVIQGSSDSEGKDIQMAYQQVSNSESAYLTGMVNEDLATIKMDANGGGASIHMNEMSSKSIEMTQGLQRNISEMLVNLKSTTPKTPEEQNKIEKAIARYESALKGSNTFLDNALNQNYRVEKGEAENLKIYFDVMQKGVSSLWEDYNVQDKKPTKDQGVTDTKQT